MARPSLWAARMPGVIHGVITELLDEHPETLAYLLELEGVPIVEALVPLPETKGRVGWVERRVDRVFLVGEKAAPVGFVMAEVQTRIDSEKRFSWPLSVEMIRSRYRCEGALVVLSTSAKVRRWLEREVFPATGLYGCRRELRPLVIALDELDCSLLLRADRPYLARLAVAARAEAEDLEEVAAEAVRITMEALPKHLAAGQIDDILGMVDHALRVKLEDNVMDRPPFRSETFRRWYAQATGEGRAIGLAEGKAEGKAEGEAVGKAEGVLTVLSARGIPVSETLRARILRCTDLETLDSWLRRAVVASSASAVVRGPSSRDAGRATRPKRALPHARPAARKKGAAKR